MEPDKRIEELEAEIRRLHGVLARTQQPALPTPAEPPRLPVPSGNNEGDPISGRVAYSRGAVVLVMTVIALALAAMATAAKTGGMEPWQKAATGYGVALGCIVLGWLSRARHHPFSHVLLGTGLAALYFSSYGVLFSEAMRVFPQHGAAWGLLAACMILFVMATHGRRSRIAAGMGLCLIYYTIWTSCTGGVTRDSILYAMVTCGALAVTAFLFQTLHGWRGFAWGVMLGVYGILHVYLWPQPVLAGISSKAYVLLTGGMATLVFILLSAATALDARRSGRYGRGLSWFAVLNVMLYALWAWRVLRTGYEAYFWLLYGGLALMLWSWSCWPRVAGYRRSLLVCVFLAMGCFFSFLFMHELLPDAEVWVAFATLGVLLDLVYWRTGMAWLKVLGVVVTGVVLLGGFFAVGLAAGVDVAGWVVPTRWFACGSLASVLLVRAWMFDWMQDVEMCEAEGSPWLFAGSWIDISHGMAALAHAACASVLLAALIVFDQAYTETLPLLLVVLGSGIAAAGLVVRAWSFQLAAMQLIVVGHLAFHYHRWPWPWASAVGMKDVTYLTESISFTLALALLTCVTGLGWERFLQLLRRDGSRGYLLHSALPYILVVLALYAAFTEKTGPVEGPLAYLGLAAGMLLLGFAAGGGGLVVGGLAAAVMGTVFYFQQMPELAQRLPAGQAYLAHLALVLAGYVILERLLWLIDKTGRTVTYMDDLVRTVVVATGGSLGVLALNRWASEGQLTWYWLLLAGLGALVGLALGETRYQWAALLTGSLAAMRGSFHDLDNLAMPVRVVIFAASQGAIILVAYLYLRYRERRAHSAVHRHHEHAFRSG